MSKRKRWTTKDLLGDEFHVRPEAQQFRIKRFLVSSNGGALHRPDPVKLLTPWCETKLRSGSWVEVMLYPWDLRRLVMDQENVLCAHCSGWGMRTVPARSERWA